MQQRFAIVSEPSSASDLESALRVLLAAISVIGLIYWSYLTLFVTAYYGIGSLASPYTVLLLFPFAYLLVSLFSSIKPPSIRTHTILTIVLNAPLVAFFIYSISAIEDYLRVTAFVPVIYVLAWSCIWLVRWFARNHTSVARQAITVGLLGAALTFGAVEVWPLMINHEAEAQRFLQEAVNGNPHEARENFAESRQHARLIHNEFGRREFLRQIAVAQANLRLYDDSSETIRVYIAEGPESRDKDQLLHQVVMSQVKNRDYNLALATAQNLEDSGSLQIQYLSLEAIAKSKAGNKDEARQILDVAITLADGQLERGQKFAFINIAEAQAEIGWHEAAVASARKSGTENWFGLLASIGIKEAEAGFKDSARDTMKLIESTVENRVTACRRLKGDQTDRCLFELVEELGDRRFFNLATSVALKIDSLAQRDYALRRVLDFGIKFGTGDLEDMISK